MEEARPDVPAGANAQCVAGTEEAGKAASCAGCPNQAACAAAPKGPDPDQAQIDERMSRFKHIILILSGKGGVGKSTFATQLAFALAARNYDIGLLDIDICGPSLPKMLGLEGEEVHQSNLGWSPVYVTDNLAVMSIGFLLGDPDDAVIWRGPRKNGLIKQFLKDTYWGDNPMDFLIIDAPPGTSDEHISIVQMLKPSKPDGGLVVTTPQDVAIIDVRKEVSFCHKSGLPVLGVVENMSGLQAPVQSMSFQARDGSDVTADVMSHLPPHLRDALACVDVFHASKGGAEAMAASMNVPFLGRVPMDPQVSRAAETGDSIQELKNAPSLPAFNRIVDDLLLRVGASPAPDGHDARMKE